MSETASQMAPGLTDSAPQLFSFGYWGWGNATPKLVEAVDAAEQARGFLPPLFVDIRIRRAVRAKGFQGNAFGALLGPRYLWMPALGNRAVQDGRPTEIEIKDPSAAAQLLDRALAEPRRRLLFYCACEQPALCHRRTVAHLVIDAAQALGEAVTVVEWPGGAPQMVELEVAPALLRQAARGQLRSVPIGRQIPLGLAAGLPWASTAWLKACGERLGVLVGPVRFDARGYYLPVLRPDSATPEAQRARALRAAGGYEPLTVEWLG